MDERRGNEAEVEKAHKSKAADDLQNWNMQRQARLNAKKEKNRSEEQVIDESMNPF